MHQNSPYWEPKSKNFLESGTAPLPRWGGDTPPHTSPPRRLRRLDPRACGARRFRSFSFTTRTLRCQLRFRPSTPLLVFSHAHVTTWRSALVKYWKTTSLLPTSPVVIHRRPTLFVGDKCGDARTYFDCCCCVGDNGISCGYNKNYQQR